jgi:hypothetical protein
MVIVPDAGKQPAQFGCGRKLAALLVGGTDRGSVGFGDDEHLPSMTSHAAVSKQDRTLRLAGHR